MDDMKTLEIEVMETIMGGVMAMSDAECIDLWHEYLGELENMDLNAAYGTVIQMHKWGCSNNPANF